jgi:histidine triad (HIT) family protein
MASDPTSNCIFCKIAAGAIPVERLYDDDLILAVPDREPQAPTHILVIPKNHITGHSDASADDQQMLGRLLSAAAEVARTQQLGAGYRLVINNGPDGGQTVPHLHLHLLGGRKMSWPPG